uniref:Uncharacterized protein n=1 Tax=Arundo donax TaxID=35708 RepID=A0A0A9DEA4_ARUDO
MELLKRCFTFLYCSSMGSMELSCSTIFQSSPVWMAPLSSRLEFGVGAMPNRAKWLKYYFHTVG